MNESFFPSTREYCRFYGLSTERVARARPDVVVMHPGPINRGIEISADVADGPHSVILDQVAAGVAVRMAVLYHLLGGS
jgi:aspartate carbamoyltransferase catalytic subunit